MHQKIVDVLIVGAGPTGLTLACELRRRGVEVKLIDQMPSRTTESRALGLQARSLEVFEKLGVLDQILDRGLPVDTVQLYENGKQIGMTSLSILSIAYPFVLIIPQADTEDVLTHRLQQLGGRIERSLTLISLRGNQATLANASGEHEVITATWIVGCDGAHSAVRHALHIPFRGIKFAENFALADVVIENCPISRHEIHGYMSPAGVLGVMALPKKNHYRLITTFHDDTQTTDLKIPFLEKVVKERTHVNLSIQDITWASMFSIHRRIVPRMSQGFVFLCGDAAHIHSPAGGQGLNIGIQDAFNLAWKLALVQQRRARTELLETYQEERQPVAQKTLWGTTFATFFISTPYRLLRHIFFKAFAALFKWNCFRKQFSATLAEVKTHYKYSRLSWQSVRDVLWRGPKPGTRAPLLESAEETRFIVLVFGAPAYNPELPGECIIRHLPLDSVMALPYHALKPCLYIIRPDGYIAFRSRTLLKDLKKEIHDNLFLW
ncbi:MAG TPA: FAD-dependent monooxygenase [Rhabdochlamydiaceae bacterium]|jgi:2-polyprenyl-6-methoxyphenol hydroxylase-like FAD-dependent oxidoreductase|nr:FAD-dependent monooxygenase [Rhabdochlamydiaceae bacterium]